MLGIRILGDAGFLLGQKQGGGGGGGGPPTTAKQEVLSKGKWHRWQGHRNSGKGCNSLILHTTLHQNLSQKEG